MKPKTNDLAAECSQALVNSDTGDSRGSTLQSLHRAKKIVSVFKQIRKISGKLTLGNSVFCSYYVLKDQRPCGM